MKRFQLKPVVRAVAEKLHRAVFGYMRRTGLILCVAHTEVVSATDTRYYVSDDVPATFNQAGFAASGMVWVEIEQVQDWPTYGAKRAINKFIPIYGPTQKTLGAKDNGEGDLIVGDLPLKPAQIMLKAAVESKAPLAFKVVSPDGETHYLYGLCAKWELSAAKEGANKLRTGTLTFTQNVVEVPAP